MRFFRTALLSACLLLPAATACAGASIAGEARWGNSIRHISGLSLTPMRYMHLEGWATDRHGEALAAFLRSCGKLRNIPAEATVGEGLLAGAAGHWHRACIEAALVSPADNVGARNFFEREFEPYQLAYQGEPRGKFTGYYEPLMRGSWQPKPGYEPIYAPPSDLVSGQTYPLTRAEIEAGGLADKAEVLMYVADPIDAFFLHVQGSGRVLMDTGEMVALRFAAKTNQPYTAIGKVLRERGALTGEITAPRIRDWLKQHPQQMREVMQQNKAYIFFSLSPELGDGPVGAQNVPLIPERSLAVDAAFIPLGTPLWLSTTLPHSMHAQGEPYRRLMVAQDKGSAILGAIRGDVFFGHGDRAEDLAGHMNSEGKLLALVPKGLARAIEGKRF